MGIFDLFTGKPAKEAANQQRIFLGQTQANNAGIVDNGLNTSLAALGTGYNTATGAVGQGYGDASSYLNTGANAARSAYDPLAALSGKYGGATTMALNALGVNGPQGQADARATFQAGPAYETNLTQGLDAINRRRAAGGMLDSGNADRDAQVFGAGLASNEYDKWMGQLLGFTNPELSATSGTATGLAGIETRLGQNQAALATNRGSMLADLAQRYGTQQAAVQTGAANAKVGNSTALAQPYAKTYGDEAQAELTGSKNMWGLGMAAAQMAMGMPPTSLGSLGTPGASAGNPNIPQMGYGPSGMPFWNA